jgi:type I restriction enzyme M protein
VAENKARNTLLCYVTGKERQATAEELVRQEYAKILVEDYGYSKSDLVLEYGVKKSPSDKNRSLPVDIAVFENGKAKIFVETKKPTLLEGIGQLKDYMNFDPDVIYGVWTNGNKEDDEIGIHYLKKSVKLKTIDYHEIVNIPEKGFYSIDEQIKKKDLKPTKNLKNIFRQMRGFIAANAKGTTRDTQILNELMSILMCKIYDERYKNENQYMDFRVINNDPEETANNIRDIFENKVKVKYPTVFMQHEEISLDDDIIMNIVGQLQKYSITSSSHQVISDSFESIISYATKGSQGQFFTPKNVVDLMVNILKPERYKKLIDPAAGTSGFLTGSMYYVWETIEKSKLEEPAKIEEKKDYAMSMLYGIEKDDFLAKISKAYMAILGDGKSGIFIEDSLNEKQWSDLARANIHQGGFDYVLTNPPFGKDVKVKKETKELYNFEKVEHIFIERSLQLLKDGGILGIILPETIFHSPTNSQLRKKLFFSNNVMCMIDIPHDTFRPYNNAKCDVIFIQKNRPQQEKILGVYVKNIGHNHAGETVFEYDIATNTFDNTKVNDDIPYIIDLLQDDSYMDKIQQKNLTESDEEEIKKLRCGSSIKWIDSKDVVESDLLVARNYFQPEIEHTNSVSIGKLIKEKVLLAFDGHGSPQGHLKGLGTVPYIRVKDVVNLEIYTNPLDLIPEFEYERLYTKSKALKEKDIIFVRRGSYRIGDVGILYPKDTSSLLTRELLVIRVKDLKNQYHITPFNLLYLLNSDEVRMQLPNKIMMDTTLPNIADRWKDLEVPIYDKEKMMKLSSEMESLYNSRKEFWSKLESITI